MCAGVDDDECEYGVPYGREGRGPEGTIAFQVELRARVKESGGRRARAGSVGGRVGTEPFGFPFTAGLAPEDEAYCSRPENESIGLPFTAGLPPDEYWSRPDSRGFWPGAACGVDLHGWLGIGVWLALVDVGVPFAPITPNSLSFCSSFRFLSSRSFRRFRASISLRTAFNFLPSPSSTTFSSSPSTIVISFPIPVLPCFPFSLSTHLCASFAEGNLIKTIPSAIPVALFICGSNDKISPYVLKYLRMFEVVTSGEIFNISTAVAGGGPALS